MKKLKCANAHFFDGEKFEKCPICGADSDEHFNMVRQSGTGKIEMHVCPFCHNMTKRSVCERCGFSLERGDNLDSLDKGQLIFSIRFDETSDYSKVYAREFHFFNKTWQGLHSSFKQNRLYYKLDGNELTVRSLLNDSKPGEWSLLKTLDSVDAKVLNIEFEKWYDSYNPETKMSTYQLSINQEGSFDISALSPVERGAFLIWLVETEANVGETGNLCFTLVLRSDETVLDPQSGQQRIFRCVDGHYYDIHRCGYKPKTADCTSNDLENTVFLRAFSTSGDKLSVSVHELYNGVINLRKEQYDFGTFRFSLLSPSASELVRIEFCECCIGERILLFPDKQIEVSFNDRIPLMIIGDGGFSGLLNSYILVFSKKPICLADFALLNIPNPCRYECTEYKKIIDSYSRESRLIDYVETWKEREKGGGFDSTKKNEEYPLKLHYGCILNGRYIVQNLLYDWHTGINYEGWDLQEDRNIIISEFLPRGAATRTPNGQIVAGNYSRFEQGKKAFLQEAEAVISLGRVDGILHVFDCFESKGTAYRILESIPNQKNFSEIVFDSKASLSEKLEMMKPVFDALRRIHSCGLVDRNLVPDNIFLTPKGQLRLLCLGNLELRGNKNNVVTLVAPGFASPEAYYKSSSYDVRSDIYSLGAILYYLVTGVRPEESTNRKIDDTLSRPRSIIPELPQNVDDAIMRAMSIKPSRRYRSVEAFERALFVENSKETAFDRLRRAFELKP